MLTNPLCGQVAAIVTFNAWLRPVLGTHQLPWRAGWSRGMVWEKPGAKLSWFSTTHASYRFKSPLKPSPGCQSRSSALHLVVTSQNAPFSPWQVWGLGSENPPGGGMVLVSSCARGTPSELLWEWGVGPGEETVPQFPLCLPW